LVYKFYWRAFCSFYSTQFSIFFPRSAISR